MELDFLWLGLGLAAFGYFLGDGLKNFKNPSSKNALDFLDDDDEHELIKANDVHHFLGISREDTNHLIEKYPDIPHLTLNGNIYYPKARLRKWLKEIGG